MVLASAIQELLQARPGGIGIGWVSEERMYLYQRSGDISPMEETLGRQRTTWRQEKAERGAWRVVRAPLGEGDRSLRDAL